MKKWCLIFLLGVFTQALFAQNFVLFSSRWTDVKSKSNGRTRSVIYIDSSRITIEQGESHLYLDVKSKQRSDNNFYYTVIDFNDAECQAAFSPEQMTFEYQSGEYRLRYYIDSIQMEKHEAEEPAEEEEVVSDSTQTDSTEVKEDNNIYTSADLMPEFPGGTEAMKTWLSQNVKYPPAAKRDKVIGLVEVTAVVEKDGSLSNINVKRDIGNGCGDEAVRAIKLMPAWVPGEIKNEQKRVKVTIKVFFPPE